MEQRHVYKNSFIRLGFLLTLLAWVNLPTGFVQASLLVVWAGVSWLIYLTRLEKAFI